MIPQDLARAYRRSHPNTLGGSVHTTYPDGLPRVMSWSEWDEDKFTHSQMWDKINPVWAQRVSPTFQFKIDHMYLSLAGKLILITETSDQCMKGHDNIWRYNRLGDLGRTTGSSWDRLTNLIPIEVQL